MKKGLLLVFALLTFSAYSQNQVTWKNDPDHTRLGFVVKHIMLSEIEGRFRDFSINVTSTKAGNDAKIPFSNIKVLLKAKTSSIDTDVEQRDKHLKSKDFFDVEKYADLTFESKCLIRLADNKGVMSGDLTMHGVTRNVVLFIDFFGLANSPMDKIDTAGFQIKGKINRKDFGIGMSFPDAIVSDTIEIVTNVEFKADQKIIK